MFAKFNASFKAFFGFAPHFEHVAAVSYAGCEVFELHAVIWYASFGLLVFGAAAMLSFFIKAS